MRIILFDIDGTLTATTNADNGCYERAFARAFGFPIPTTDWHCYKHVTDIGIIQEVMEKAGRDQASKGAIDRFEEIYEQELTASFEKHSAGFIEVPGARALLETLRDRGVPAALSTGGMRRTALFKLRQIGVDGARMPGAFANDAISRADIARTAIRRSGITPSDVVYFGDGSWDATTAAELGMRFVGVCREYSRDRLLQAGATTIIDDYADHAEVFEAIESAGVPRTPSA
ncbi:MAG: HAD family phosphatase [Candidatus Hydrogenedentes bacterium]|nr:HAD family phosphatase [Candidatus Hydrogenedentota bacterium]